jgi:hypothetical protein
LAENKLTAWDPWLLEGQGFAAFLGVGVPSPDFIFGLSDWVCRVPAYREGTGERSVGSDFKVTLERFRPAQRLLADGA